MTVDGGTTDKWARWAEVVGAIRAVWSYLRAVIGAVRSPCVQWVTRFRFAVTTEVNIPLGRKREPLSAALRGQMSWRGTA